MKEVKIILSLCLVSVLFFLTYIFFESPKNVTTFRRYTSPDYKINKSIIEVLNENNDANEENLEKEVIKTVLNIIGYEKWNEFVDYVSMDIYYANLVPNFPDQLILSLNLSKDSGVVVIFDEVENNYIFNNKIENLSPIDNINVINHPTEDTVFLAIYQIIDESLGAFFRENFVQIYKYDKPDFNIVWEKTMFYEEILKENWIDIEAPDTNWTMVIEQTEIDFNFTESIKINTITSLKKYEAKSKNTPEKDDFSLKEEKLYTRPYYWNDEYNTFVLGELTKDVFLSNVAILDDMEERQEWLFGITNPYYRLSTSNKETLYLPKSKFSKLFSNILEN